MKTTCLSRDRRAYGAIEETKADCDPSEGEFCLNRLRDVLFPTFQVVFYPSAVLLASTVVTILDNHHHGFKQITAYIGWFFLVRSIQGTPNPLALVNCSILILSSSYVEGDVSRECMTAIFVGSSMVFWLPQITRYRPAKGSLQDFLKSVGTIRLLCLMAAQLVIGILFFVPQSLKIIMDGPKIHFDLLDSIGVRRSMFILEGLSFIVVGFRLKKPILFVHDRLAFPFLVSSVVSPLCFWIPLAVSKSEPLDFRAWQVLAVAWTLAAEVTVISFFWTHCCCWPWSDSVEIPSSFSFAVTFGHRVLYLHDVRPNRALRTHDVRLKWLRRIPGRRGDYRASFTTGTGCVIEDDLTDSGTAVLAACIRQMFGSAGVIAHWAGSDCFVLPQISMNVVASLSLGYFGWFLIGYYMKKGYYTAELVPVSALVAWGSPSAGHLCVERFLAIACVSNLLLGLPLFISRDKSDFRCDPCVLLDFRTELVMIGGAIYFVAECAFLFLISFGAILLAIEVAEETWDEQWNNYELQPCSTFLLIAAGITAVIPLGIAYYQNGRFTRELPLEMGAFGTILSLVMRYLSTNGPLTLLVPRADSPTYQVATALITIGVEVLVITLHSWYRRRRSPEDYLFSWWRTSSAKVPIESV